MRPDILIVEDDENLRVGLCDNLESEGYRVHVARTGAEAEGALRGQRFSLVVLDVMLPDTDGYTLCQQMRARGDDTLVLMLTARTLEDDLVRGFDSGADDYLKKPYRLRELLSRVAALLRRAGVSRANDGFIALGHLRLDPSARELFTEDGERVDLTRTEFDLLTLFLGRDGDALSRDEILDAVWGKDVVVDTRTVDNFVSNLKKKLSWSEDCSWAIETVRGFGYRFVRTPDGSSTTG